MLRNGSDLSARRLADQVNCSLSTLVRAPFLVPVSRAEVERALASLSSAEGTLSFSPRLAEPQQTLHKWQHRALTQWRAADRRGIVAAVTGAGKTLLGIAAIAEHVCVPSARAVVLVPTIELMHQWCAQLERAFFVTVGAVGDAEAAGLADHMIVVFVARSAAEMLVPEVTRIADPGQVLLIADECHRYGAESYARALRAPYGATLGLSATPERDHDSGMERHVFPSIGPVVFEYDHQRAVSEKVVSDFQVLFVGVEFEPIEQSRHDELSLQIARARGALCAAHPYLENAKPFVEAVKLLAGRDEDEHALRWLSLVAERRRLLCSAKQRHAFVAWLAARPEIAQTQMLIFHESIEDCELLAETLAKAGVPAKAHHSGLERFERAGALARFAAGEIRAIVSPHTLDEGIDVPDASLAVIVAGSRVKRQNIQRVGRILRRTVGKKSARVIRVFVRGSADDPAAPYPDRFSRVMIESGRGSIATWPHDSPSVVAFIRNPPSEGSSDLRMRSRKTLAEHGLTESTFAALYESQNGCCGICGISEPELGRKFSSSDGWESDRMLHVDHEHGSSPHRVRGLLCRDCNYDLEAFIRNKPITHPGGRGRSFPRGDPRFISYLNAVPPPDPAERVGQGIGPST
jgi:superfamily II DNA or RNA helicase